jgi:hypothetical protein
MTDVGKKMDAKYADLESELNAKLSLFGFNKHVAGKRDLMSLMERQGERRQGAGMSEVRRYSKDNKNDDPERRYGEDTAPW